jgi:hypothetical protein
MPLFSFFRRSPSSSSLSSSASSTPSSLPLNNNNELFKEEKEEGSINHKRWGLLSGFRKHRYRSRQATSSMYCCSSSRSPSSSTNRRGMTFLGFCDYRIATVLLNVLHMVLALVLEICEAIEWDRNYLEEPPVITLLVVGTFIQKEYHMIFEIRNVEDYVCARYTFICLHHPHFVSSSFSSLPCRSIDLPTTMHII